MFMKSRIAVGRCYRHSAMWLALALACQAGHAQGNLADWKNVQNLLPLSGISVETKTGEKYHGSLLEISPDSLTIDSDEPAFPGRTKRRRELRRGDIREVRHLASLASVLAAGAIGTGVGAGIGVGAESASRSKEGRGLVIGTLALLGLAIGVAIGVHHHPVKGKVVYFAP
jgi:hypothetical protein